MAGRRRRPASTSWLEIRVARGLTLGVSLTAKLRRVMCGDGRRARAAVRVAGRREQPDLSGGPCAQRARCAGREGAGQLEIAIYSFGSAPRTTPRAVCATSELGGRGCRLRVRRQRRRKWQANDTLKPSGARVREGIWLSAWRVPGPISILAPIALDRPQLNVGR